MKKVEVDFRKSAVKTNENVEDITKLPKYRLLELLQRQENVLKNRVALNKLPDKGDKVRRTKKQIEDELARRAEANKNLCLAMEGLTLSAPQVNALEWTKNFNELEKKSKEDIRSIALNENPFQILATHSGTTISKKILRIEEKTEPLITETDLEEIYAIKLRSKIDNVEPTSRFLPHKTLTHKFISKKLSNKNKAEDLSAALEPSSKFGSVKPVSLEASVKLQYDHVQNLKELQLKQAQERLKDKTYTIGNVLPKLNVTSYRNQNVASSDTEDTGDEEYQEAEDEECTEEDKAGIVNYHVTE